MSIYRYQRINRSNGSMLTLSIVSLVVICLIILTFFVIYFLFFTQNRLQDSSDEIALTGARAMNAHDYVGQINNLVAFSRQLVFNSRNAYDQSTHSEVPVQSLAAILLNESRAGAEMVSKDRETLLQLTNKNIREIANSAGDKAMSKSNFQLPWAKSQAPSILNLELGFLKDVDSNVEAPTGNSGLYALDQSQQLINQKTHLYRGNISLPLIGPESDLKFKLASLPAPVKGTVAPARLLSTTSFQNLSYIVKNGKTVKGNFDQFPSALKLDTQVQVEANSGKEMKNTVQAHSFSAAGGANPLPTQAN